MKPTYIIHNETELKNMFRAAYDNALRALKGGAVVLKLDRENRTLQQNAKLWPMLSDLSKQTTYAGKKRTPEDWKLICFQAWQECETDEDKKMEYVPSFGGGAMVVLGCSTSSLNKKEFAGLIETIYMIGSHYQIQWSEKAIDYFAEYGIN